MTVTTADLGAARIIGWDRRARLNAWELSTMTAIADAIEEAGSQEAVRCVVLRGAGRAVANEAAQTAGHVCATALWDLPASALEAARPVLRSLAAHEALEAP